MKKIIHATNHEDFIPEKKSYRKPKPYVMSDSLKEYIKERDRYFWKKYPYLRKEIEERYNVK